MKIDIDFIGLPVINEHRYGYSHRLVIPCSGREFNFKMAAVSLVLRGIYPSGRQILKEMGSDRVKGRKLNLNGDECHWKDEIFNLFQIKPYFGYTKKYHREAWEETVANETFMFERGSKGTLIPFKVNDDE